MYTWAGPGQWPMRITVRNAYGYLCPAPALPSRRARCSNKLVPKKPAISHLAARRAARSTTRAPDAWPDGSASAMGPNYRIH